MSYTDFSQWENYNPSDRNITYDDFWRMKSMAIWYKYMSAKAIREFAPDSKVDREHLEWKLDSTSEWEVVFGTGQHANKPFDAAMWYRTGKMELILSEGGAVYGMAATAAAITALNLF